MKHLTLLSLVLLVLWLGISFYVGGEVGRIHEQLTTSQDPAMPLVLRSGELQRGLLTSRADTQILLAGEEVPARLAGTALGLRHRIIHGPLPVLAWWRQGGFPRLAQTVIESRPDDDSTLLARLGLPGEVLIDLRIITWVALDGKVEIVLELPADLQVEEDGQILRIARLHGEATLAPTGEAGRGQLLLEALRWCGAAPEPGCLQLDTRLAVETAAGAGTPLWRAEGTLIVDENWLVARLRQGFLARRTATDESADARVEMLATDQARQQIALLVGARILQRERDRLRLALFWEAGELRLNGEPRAWMQVFPVLSVVAAQLVGEV